MTNLTTWAMHQPLMATAAGALLLAAVVPLARAIGKATDWPPAAVLVASLAAMACTAYSADTSWRFARDSLGMTATGERAAMFAAAELALFACALMARQNLRGPQKAPGAPGVLVWVITGVQVIPAYSESGPVGGTVRAVVGPVLAALLWHLAMGIELRHAKPGTESSSLPALIGRELRERLLSRLGLAVRDRTAEQITRDRATARAVQLAARPKLRRWGRSRLAAAVARSGVGTDAEQREVMMRQLAARRGALGLQTITLDSPFAPVLPAAVEPATEGRPALPAARPPVVPARVRLLPLVARPVTPAPGREAQVFVEQPAHPVPHRPEPVPPAPEPAEPISVQAVPHPAPDPVDAVPVGSVLGPWHPLERRRAGTNGTGLRLREYRPWTLPREIPEPAPEPVPPTVPPTGTSNGTGAADIETIDSTNTTFAARVATVRNWLKTEPELTGTEIGTRLGVSDGYGRRLLRKARETP